MNYKWYIAKCPSGAEQSSLRLLKEALIKLKAEANFAEYFIPYDKKEQRASRKSVMGNYIFIKLHIDELTKKAIKQVEKMSFMLDQNLEPALANEEEIETMKLNLSKKAEEELSTFKEGENILVKKAPFENFKGVIESIDLKKSIAKVAIPIFDTKTMIDLPFDSIERIKE